MVTATKQLEYTRTVRPAADASRVVSARGELIAPHVLDRLEQLDDALFAALAGDEAAIACFDRRWRSAIEDTPAELIDDTRRHYLRHARRSAAPAASRRLLSMLSA